MNKSIKSVLIIFIGILLTVILYNIFNIDKKILIFFYPIHFKEYVYKYSEELNISPFLTLAIIKTESNFNVNAKSSSGAVGLMQLMEETAKEQAQKLNINFNYEMLYNPEKNLELGLNYFNTLLDYYNQNYILAIIAYNAGIGNVEKWIKDGIINSDGANIEKIPFKETNMYVRKVINNYELYKELYS